MGFKNTLKAYQEKVSGKATLEVLEMAVTKSSQAVKLQALIDAASLIVVPAFDQFVQDATSENYYAEWHFHKEEWRCWWSLSFVPAPDEPPINGFQLNENVVGALVRGHHDGEISLEMNCREPYFYRLLDAQRLRKMTLIDLTSPCIQAWLDEFMLVALDFRSSEEKAKHG